MPGDEPLPLEEGGVVGAVIGELRGRDQVVQRAFGWADVGALDPNVVRASLPHHMPGAASQQLCDAGAGHAGQKPAHVAREGGCLCQIGGDDPLVV